MSEYICSTPSCAIALSKAAFPVNMNCPVCQQALTQLIEKPILSEEYELLISNLPYVIAFPLKRALLEKHPWTKINLLKDTFLNYLKYIGLITASEFFNSPLKDKKMVALFQQALAEPSFGSWNHYIRETLSYLKENNHSFFCSDLLSYYDLIESGKKRKLFKGEIEIMDANGDIQIKKQEATAIGMLINFRNRYLGHGLTLDESDANNYWEMYFPIFRELLVQLKFSVVYPMFKCEHGETYLLKSAEISLVEKGNQTSSRVWIENPEGSSMDILPFFVVPGEVSIGKEDKAQLLTYESHTGKTIKFFSPEGTEKQTSGKILEKLNLLLRDKQKETPFSPEAFTKDEFLKRITEENKLLLETLISEKKIIPGIYQHREEMEIKLREWIGVRANIFFIVAEAGSGKTNLLVEIQRQYTERDLPSLLIRAGRMEKQSLKEQIAYLLNIDLQQGLVNYASIAGTQSQPTFILIDGLNEANNAEEIWQEIIDLSKVFIPGSIKFVVTNRANTKAELNRYLISENDYNLLYGENKDHEIGLGAYSFWLTALDMKEMKGSWEAYAEKHKAKFKPLFSFDTIAEFDRALYNQINNPLILRLFLEIYNGKSLPRKGVKHLNIWQDWFKNFSEAEQTFLQLVANEVWLKGENELLLDDLLQHKKLKPYFTSDIINAPYNRLKNNGWVSRYVKDLNTCIAFTVEGSLFYILGKQIVYNHIGQTFNEIVEILKEGNSLKYASIEEFLCQKSTEGDLSLVIDLIDLGDDYINISIKPLIRFMKSFGCNFVIDNILKNPTENDWKTFEKIETYLSDIEEKNLKKEFLESLIPYNNFAYKSSILLGLRTCLVLDNQSSRLYLLKIESIKNDKLDDFEFLIIIGDIKRRLADFNVSREYYQKSVDRLKNNLSKQIDYAHALHKMGVIEHEIGNFDRALNFYNESLKIRLTHLKKEDPEVANSYNSIGASFSSKKCYSEAIDFLEKSLEIRLKILGERHTDTLATYNNVAMVLSEKGEIQKALDIFEKCATIEIINFGDSHPELADTYNNIGVTLQRLGRFDKALEYYEKCLFIEINTLGNDHPFVASTYSNIGEVLENKGENENAFKYFVLSCNIRYEKFGIGHVESIETYFNTRRLANLLGKENDLPEWIKTIKL